MCNWRGRGVRERKESCVNIEKERAFKKSDDCDEQTSLSSLAMSKLGCLLHGVDFRAIFVFLLVAPACVFTLYCHYQKLTYFLRPLWESPPKPFVPLTHYYNPNVSMATLCRLHGWGIRESPRRVYDAVLFSNEIDMLTIRWKELHPYVTGYVLLESNSTFTGLPKPLNFAIHRELFKSIEARLTYGEIGGRFRRGENPFVEEAYQRLALDQLIRVAGIEHDDLLIMSDVDEIPSGHTIDLLRWCDDVPKVIHLQLRNYLYSFEFQQHQLSWRASVHRYRKGRTRYAHYRQTDLLLPESGWHCSFCFRHISDFVFKMKAYSHSDRVRFSRFLNLKRIQDIICTGGDLYDMLPEEYTFRDIIGTMGPIPHSLSAVDLPSYLLENAEKYKYLLPGNCVRERG